MRGAGMLSGQVQLSVDMMRGGARYARGFCEIIRTANIVERLLQSLIIL